VIGLLLDFDGTIAETERFGHRVAYNEAFAELGLPWHWDEALYGELLAVAGGKERLAFYLRRYREERLSADSLEEFVRRIYAVKQRRFAALAATIPLRPGVRRLVREARAAGLRLAIVTTASPEGVRALLRHHPDVLSAFDLIAAGDVVARKKPAADIYRWALERLALEPRACLAVEDSHLGLRASLDAGVRTLVTVSGYTVDEDHAGSAAVLSDLGEPEAPVRVLSGDGPANGIVDVAFVRETVERC